MCLCWSFSCTAVLVFCCVLLVLVMFSLVSDWLIRLLLFSPVKGFGFERFISEITYGVLIGWAFCTFT